MAAWSQAFGGPRSEMHEALRAHGAAFAGIGIISGVVNLLYLTGSFFMLEVYDRVLPSRSVPTLIGLCIIATFLYTFQGILDVIRNRLLARIGVGLDRKLSGRVYSILLQLPLRASATSDGLQPLRDLDQVRMFLSSSGPTALFDLPWMPLYVAICFGFHVWIGITALAGACVLIIVTVLTEALSRAPATQAVLLGSQRNGLAESSRRNAEVIRAMGMDATVSGNWGELNARYMDRQRAAADVSNGFGAVSRVIRAMLQSGVLAVGAYLVIEQQSTAGVIIASSILTARALAPIELAIANWRTFVGARQSWARLRDLVTSIAVAPMPAQLPPPMARLDLEAISVAPPGVRVIAVNDVSLSLRAGQGLGVIGPSASGKSSLARAIVGVWPTLRGKVRIDGAALDQWHPEKLGPHIGYLPQDVELFDGTVAQNIARFDGGASSQVIVEAAIAAGVHDLILRLPNGYETQIGVSGATLSAGQRQRVALARALFRAPFLVVLDEPNSNLDQDGEAALNGAIKRVRDRGGILVVVAHRAGTLSNVDQLLVMQEGGRVRAVGPKDEILAKMSRPAEVSAAAPLTVVTNKSQ